MVMHKHAGIFCTSTSFGGLEINTLRLVGWMKEQDWEMPVLFMEESPLARDAGKRGFDATVLRTGGMLSRLRQLDRWVKEKDIRIIMVPFNKDLKIAAMYKRFMNRRIKLVYQQHMQVGVPKRDVIHTLRYKMLDAWIAPLQYLKEEALVKTKVPEWKIHVIPLGLDAEPLINSEMTSAEARDAFLLPSDTFIIGTLGRLDPKKGQDIVVRALHILREQYNADIHVLLVGDTTLNEGDAYSQELAKLITEYQLQERVHLRPYQPEVVTFFRAIDVFAMPSHGETYGMVTLEAMAAGVPILGADKDGTHELLKSGKLGYLFEVNSAEDMVRAFMKMKDDPDIVEKLDYARETVVQEFNAKDMCHGIIRLLEGL